MLFESVEWTLKKWLQNNAKRIWASILFDPDENKLFFLFFTINIICAFDITTMWKICCVDIKLQMFWGVMSYPFATQSHIFGEILQYLWFLFLLKLENNTHFNLFKKIKMHYLLTCLINGTLGLIPVKNTLLMCMNLNAKFLIFDKK